MARVKKSDALMDPFPPGALVDCAPDLMGDEVDEVLSEAEINAYRGQSGRPYDYATEILRIQRRIANIEAYLKNLTRAMEHIGVPAFIEVPHDD
jgi:hypothetical protein